MVKLLRQTHKNPACRVFVEALVTRYASTLAWISRKPIPGIVNHLHLHACIFYEDRFSCCLTQLSNVVETRSSPS